MWMQEPWVQGWEIWKSTGSWQKGGWDIWKTTGSWEKGRMTRFGNKEDPRENGLNPKTPKWWKMEMGEKDICRNHEALQTEPEKEEGKFGDQKILYIYCTLVIFPILWWVMISPPDHGMLANCAKVGTKLLFPKLDCPQRMGVQMENLKIE